MQKRARREILVRELLRKHGFEMLSQGIPKAEIARALDIDYKLGEASQDKWPRCMEGQGA
jgi:hypothetical protein